MKVLVTGGAGFIGSFLVDELVRCGHEVTIFDNLDPQIHPEGKPPEYLNQAARFVQGDVRDYDSLKRVVLSQEAILHKASAVGVGQSQYEVKKYVDVNVGGTANLIDILVNHRHQVRKLIVAASMSSYGEGSYRCGRCGISGVRPPLRSQIPLAKKQWEPLCSGCGGQLAPVPTEEEEKQNCNSVYAISKQTQEELVINYGRTYGVPSVSLRYFNVFGPRQSLSNPYTGVVAIFMSRIKNGRPPVIYEDGGQSRDFISVHDVVRANLAALEADTGAHAICNIGSGRPTAIKEVARLLARLYGREEIVPDITNKFRKGDVRHCYADIRRAREALGFSCSVSLEEGLREIVAWSPRAHSEDRFALAEQELINKGLQQ